MIQIDQHIIDAIAYAVSFGRENPITTGAAMWALYRAARATKATWDDKLYNWLAGKLGFIPGVRNL